MNDAKKTKKQLIDELKKLRKCAADREIAEQKNKTNLLEQRLVQQFHVEERAKEEAIDRLRESEEALRILHAITSTQDLNSGEKIEGLLKMGCQKFGLPIGILAHIQGERYEVVEAAAPEDTLSKGDIFKLGNTYCSETIKVDSPVFFKHAAESEWKIHPCYTAFQLESYIAIRLTIKGQIYGTLNFSSPLRRDVSFTSTDKEFLKLMAQWVEGELERERMVIELSKIEKLESIGILAGGIAHDFNNILTGVLGNISLAQCYTEPGSKILKILKEAEKATFRAAGLTQQLLTFSKGGEPVRKTASITEIIKESVSFTLRGSSASCKFFFPEDLWPVEVDEGQIYQVIQNMVINADQASPEGGTIEIRAENIVLKEGLSPQNTTAGNYVKFSIKDHGIGIPEANRSKIFDPFFTTKQQGSGLGLATTYSIIQKHGGHIEVDSEYGIGTTFIIHLPASGKKWEPTLQEAPSDQQGNSSILLMDDEKVVRKTCAEILHTLGYEVTLAKDGVEMLMLYQNARDEGKRFDAVIMDLTIHEGMGGKEAMGNLLKVDAKAKVIISSGYSNDPVMANYQDYGYQGMITKPYKLTALHNVLQEVLGAPD